MEQNETDGIGNQSYDISTNPLTETSINPLDFLKHFEQAETGKFYPLTRFPIKEEAIAITRAPKEVIVIKNRDGNSFIAKGKSSEEVGILPQDITGLDPEQIVHTHPPEQGDESGELQKIKEGVPSPQDLNGIELGASRFYIWTRFGRTSYQPIHDKRTGHSEQIIENGLLRAQKKAVQKRPKTGKEALNVMGEEMNILGCSFSFNEWQELTEID